MRVGITKLMYLVIKGEITQHLYAMFGITAHRHFLYFLTSVRVYRFRIVCFQLTLLNPLETHSGSSVHPQFRTVFP